MGESVRIQELREHTMEGQPPDGSATWREFGEKIPLYPIVNRDMLYKDDPDPFHVVLDVLETGAISDNGLEYTTELVNTIETQLPGSGGIRGHIPAEAEGFAFPVDDVDWIGHTHIGTKTYAKAYIPPGTTREFVRRLIARGGKLRTSIRGEGIQETVDPQKRQWRVREFRLDGLDLAPAGRAALRKYQSGRIIATREMSDEEGDMPDPVTLADVPQAVREQILQEAGVKTRLTEMESTLTAVTKALEKVPGEKLTDKVAELVQYQRIVAEISANIDPKQDVVQVFSEYQNSISKLAEMLGVPYTNITLRVEQMHEQIAEMKRKEFDGVVNTKVAEMTPWKAPNEKAQEKVDALRRNFKRTVLAELNGATEATKVAEIAQKVWDADFKLLAEMLVRELGGPPAIVGGAANDGSPVKISDEQLQEWGTRYVRPSVNGGNK